MRNRIYYFFLRPCGGLLAFFVYLIWLVGECRDIERKMRTTRSCGDRERGGNCAVLASLHFGCTQQLVFYAAECVSSFIEMRRFYFALFEQTKYLFGSWKGQKSSVRAVDTLWDRLKINKSVTRPRKVISSSYGPYIILIDWEPLLITGYPIAYFNAFKIHAPQ